MTTNTCTGKNSRFKPAFGELSGNAQGLSKAQWKAHCRIPIIDYKNKNWLQFLFIVKAAVLKQQISKFYPQI